jgi:hypothetical protein
MKTLSSRNITCPRVLGVLVLLLCMGANGQTDGPYPLWQVISDNSVRAGFSVNSRLLFDTRTQSLGKTWLRKHEDKAFAHLSFWADVRYLSPYSNTYSEDPVAYFFSQPSPWTIDRTIIHSELIRIGQCSVFRSYSGTFPMNRKVDCANGDPLRRMINDKSVEIIHIGYRSAMAVPDSKVPDSFGVITYTTHRGRERCNVFLRTSLPLTQLELIAAANWVAALIPIRDITLEVRADSYFIDDQFSLHVAFVEDVPPISKSEWLGRWCAYCMSGSYFPGGGPPQCVVRKQ